MPRRSNLFLVAGNNGFLWNLPFGVNGLDYVVIDLETTGLDAQKAKIIEIGLVKVKNDQVVDRWQTFVNPHCFLPKQITELTGITGKMIQNAPDWEDVLPRLLELTKGFVCVAHNVSFEKSFLAYFMPQAQWLDSIDVAKIAWPKEKSYSLSLLAKEKEIENPQAHRALADAETTAFLLNKAKQVIASFSREALHNLYLMSAEGEGPFARYIFEIVSEQLLHWQAIPMHGSPLFAAANEEAVFSKKKKKEEKEFIPLETDEIVSYFMEGGKGQSAYEQFEYRPQQLEMAAAVTDCFNQGGILAAEAGTGTGKSLAYLLPSVLFALQNGKRVGISTYTINLQEQLLHKDIPMLQKWLQKEFSVALLKGRNNYLCRRRWQLYAAQAEKEKLPFYLRLGVWLTKTKTGDISELSLLGRDKFLWNTVAATKENCLGIACPFFRKGCFVQEARVKAAEAELVIINHSLLLAGSTMEKGVLPPLPYLVVDEAHHLSKVAEEQMTVSLSYHAILSIYHRLLGKRKENDILLFLEQQVYLANVQEDEVAEIKLLIQEVKDCLEDGKKELETFFSYLGAIFRPLVQQNAYASVQFRWQPQLKEEAFWLETEIAIQNFIEVSQKAIHSVEALQKKIDKVEKLYHLSFNHVGELDYFITNIHSILIQIGNASAVVNQEEEQYTAWLDFLPNAYYPILYVAPLEIGHELCELLLSGRDGLVFTSATLTIQDDFSYFFENIGMQEMREEIDVLQLTSPFYYDDQMLFVTCTDLSEPSQVPESQWVGEISRAISGLIQAANGRTLVLFTSHSQLKSVYQNIREDLAGKKIRLLAHGLSGNRQQILEEFRNTERCCLMGANSFWEGVDVIGESLSLVIIVKLPFWPPAMPTTAARLENMAKAGRDGFREYSLPQAIIRFKQGFGRLIRSTEDSGVVCLLDKRMLTKYYGRFFLEELPTNRIEQGSWEEAASMISRWLEK